MGTLRNAWKWCQWILTSMLVTYLVLLAAVQTSQQITRRRAEHLLSDLRGLHLEKSSWVDGQALIRRWGKWGYYEGACNAKSCEYDISIEDPAAKVFERLAKWERFWILFRQPAEMTMVALGDHLPDVRGVFRVESNLIVMTYFSLGTYVPFDGELMSHAIGKRGLENDLVWPEKDSHPDYRTIVRSGTLAYFFTQFTAATKPADVEWLTSFNFSCITRWVPCKEFGDLRPSAWERHEAQNKQRSATRQRIYDCAYPLEDLVRASENVVLVQKELPNSQTPQFTSSVRLVEKLKGSASWHAGEVRNLSFECVTAPQILLFAEDANPIYPHDCGVIPATPKNLATVKAAVERTH